MKLKTAAIISTVIVMAVGFAMISPLFFRTGRAEYEQVEPEQAEPEQKVMLVFSVSQESGAVAWCEKLASILNSYNIGASVFIVGKLAERYPRCVACFGNEVDIGSQTYSNVNLTEISDYDLKLDEVERGKMAVDSAGKLTSKSFMAPFGATDDDIYSLLSSSGILADFSYSNQYNLYWDGEFFKFDVVTYRGCNYPPNYFLTVSRTDEPIIISFDNTYPISSLEAFISELKKGDIQFVNASDLAGFALTMR